MMVAAFADGRAGAAAYPIERDRRARTKPGAAPRAGFAGGYRRHRRSDPLPRLGPTARQRAAAAPPGARPGADRLGLGAGRPTTARLDPPAGPGPARPRAVGGTARRLWPRFARLRPAHRTAGLG